MDKKKIFKMRAVNPPALLEDGIITDREHRVERAKWCVLGTGAGEGTNSSNHLGLSFG